jgi:hypothetical protein
MPRNVKIKRYKTITLPVVWYGCETWFLTLNKESGWCVFVSRVLRRLLVQNRDGRSEGRVQKISYMTRNSPLYIIRMMKSGKILIRSVRHIVRMGTIISAVGKLQWKKTFDNPRRRSDDDIKMDVKEISC